MVTNTLPPLSSKPRKAVQMPSSNRPPLPTARYPPRPAAPPSGGSERSTRSGSAFKNFAYPERRKPLRPDTPLAPRADARVPVAAGANDHYVFVYGSLRRDFAHSRLMDRATCIGEFRTVTRYPLATLAAEKAQYMLDVPDKGERVKGEVYAMDDALLADLDHLEKVGLVNKRKIVKVCSCKDRSFVADAYIYFRTQGLDALARTGAEEKPRRRSGSTLGHLARSSSSSHR